MAYLKDELQGFVPAETAAEIMKDVARGSSVLKLSKVEEMKSDTKKIPILTDGPGAYWVGETERIQTSSATWIFPEMTAKKLAVIIPTTREKLEDATIDVFEAMKEPIAEAFYTTFDKAAIFGTASPFAKNLLGVATTAGNVVELGTNATLDLDISDIMAAVEDAGQDINGFAAHYGMKNSIRKLRDANGAPLFNVENNQTSFYNEPIEFVRNGGWDKTAAHFVGGNWDYSLVGIRQEIKYEVLTEATLQSVTMADGKPLSLAENDMIAIKATMRIGYLPLKDEAFSALIPPAGV